MATEKPRFTIILEPDIANQVDAYWHANKLKNKNAAINELLRMALGNKEALSSDEVRLLRYYRKSPAIAKRMSLRSLQTAVSYSSTHYSYMAPTPNRLGTTPPSAIASISEDSITYTERIDSMAEFEQELDTALSDRLEAAISAHQEDESSHG